MKNRLRNRVTGFVVFLVLCVGAALVPMACGSDSTNDDAGSDAMTPS